MTKYLTNKILRFFIWYKGLFSPKKLIKEQEEIITLFTEEIYGEKYPVELVRKEGEKPMIRKTTPSFIFGEEPKILVDILELPLFIKERLSLSAKLEKHFLNIGVEYRNENGGSQISLLVNLKFGRLVCFFDRNDCMQAILYGLGEKIIFSHEELDNDDLMKYIDEIYSEFVMDHRELIKKYDWRIV